ncbi:hypothetical protein PS2_008589 [Malus domestica]
MPITVLCLLFLTLGTIDGALYGMRLFKLFGCQTDTKFSIVPFVLYPKLIFVVRLPERRSMEIRSSGSFSSQDKKVKLEEGDRDNSQQLGIGKQQDLQPLFTLPIPNTIVPSASKEPWFSILAELPMERKRSGR